MFHDIFISQIVGKFLQNFSGNFLKNNNTFPEKFCRKFPEISQRTTLMRGMHPNGTFFSSAAPQICNYHIPTAIRVSPSLDSFKRHLKTHYFASP